MDTVWQDASGWPGTFSVADISMADVLRLIDRFDGLARTPPAAPTSRATARLVFAKAHADQIAHFASAG
jgi:glutathione S-transferase